MDTKRKVSSGGDFDGADGGIWWWWWHGL